MSKGWPDTPAMHRARFIGMEVWQLKGMLVNLRKISSRVAGTEHLDRTMAYEASRCLKEAVRQIETAIRIMGRNPETQAERERVNQKRPSKTS